MKYLDTIVAQSTPVGNGAIGIIRISGQNTYNLMQKIIGKTLKPRYAEYLKFFDIYNNVIDKGIVIWFPKPNSFTGEDMLELQCHGGQLLINIFLKNIIMLPNIRLAKPGEFSERAFLNKKIDLTQAEATIDLINAKSEQEAKAAVNSLQGNFSKIVHNLLDELTQIRSFIEANIDFVDQDIDILEEKKIKYQLKKILKKIKISINEAKKARKVCDILNIIIIGETNTGKSSLMNILTGKNTSIVTSIAGTTRDVIQEYIDINNDKENSSISVRLIDTAGFRKTKNLIELIGIKKSKETIKNADHILYIIDASKNNKNDIYKIIKNNKYFDISLSHFVKKDNLTFVFNKIDIKKNQNSRIEKNTVFLSALTGEGIDLLLSHLKNKLFKRQNVNNSQFLIRYRHIESLKKVKNSINNVINYISVNNFMNQELIAEELSLAQQYLGEITGKFTSTNLLSNIFKNFCIGK